MYDRESNWMWKQIQPKHKSNEQTNETIIKRAKRNEMNWNELRRNETKRIDTYWNESNSILKRECFTHKTMPFIRVFRLCGIAHKCGSFHHSAEHPAVYSCKSAQSLHTQSSHLQVPNIHARPSTRQHAQKVKASRDRARRCKVKFAQSSRQEVWSWRVHHRWLLPSPKVHK